MKIRLPETYREFILKVNGGIPKETLLRTPAGVDVDVSIILPVTEGKIEETTLLFPDCLSRGLLPVALGGGGDCVFLDLNSGQIFFWDHEIHSHHGFRSWDLTYLADSISDLFFSQAGSLAQEYRLDVIEKIGRQGDSKILAEFLKSNPINSKNTKGRTVAAEAVRYGNLSLLKECIERGAAIERLLHYAARNNRTDVIDYLLDIGADINETDDRGRTPLACAIVYDEIRDYLVARGATSVPGETKLTML